MDSKVMQKISYGLYVLTANNGEKHNGCIVNTLSQVTSNPEKVSITVNKANYTHQMIKESGKFAVSIISQDATFDLFKQFGFQSGRDVDKFTDFSDYVCGQTLCESISLVDSLSDVTDIEWGNNEVVSIKIERV